MEIANTLAAKRTIDLVRISWAGQGGLRKKHIKKGLEILRCVIRDERGGKDEES